jgi:hypothetical protein
MRQQLVGQTRAQSDRRFAEFVAEPTKLMPVLD